MRPYLAIIKDSFREAFASRVLWIILILIVLFLGLMAPIGFSEKLTTGISTTEVKNWSRFINQLERQNRSSRPSPGKHILSMVDPDLRDQILGNDKDEEEPAEDEESKLDDRNRGQMPEQFTVPMELTAALNDDLLRKAEFYDQDSWSGKRLRGEAEDLVARELSSLTPEELEHRNRLLLDSAFPTVINPAPTRSVTFRYLLWDITEFRVEKKTFQESIQMIVLWALLLIFGTTGIFISILVTASIIPQTFDPGSLNVLLSKPISRSLMFVSQYLGGCVFVGICASILFAGIFLILGFRLDYWNIKLLYYVPSFVFVFAIYYSVSALVGLIWRSPIMSTVVTFAFWAACAVVGWVDFFAETFILSELRTDSVIVASDRLYPVSGEGNLLTLSGDNNWKQLGNNPDLDANVAMASLGPIYDPKRERVISRQMTIQEGSPMPFSMSSEFSYAGEADGFMRHAGEGLPYNTVDLIPHPVFGFLVVTPDSFFHYKGEMPLETEEVEENEGKKKSALSSVLSALGGGDSVGESFVELGPGNGELVLAPPCSLSVNMKTGDIAAFSRGKLSLLEVNGADELSVKKCIDVDMDDRVKTHLAYVDHTIALAPANKPVQFYDDESLEMVGESSPEINTAIRSVEVSPDGSCAVFVYQNKHLRLLEGETNKFVRPSIASGNYVDAASFDARGNLVYVDNYRKVRRYSLGQESELEAIQCEYTVPQNVCRYVIKPLNSTFPQPGRLSNTMQYFVTGDDTREDYTVTFMRLVSFANPFLPMEQLVEGTPRVNLYPWPPVWNGLIFTGIMLLIGCVFIERQQY